MTPEQSHFVVSMIASGFVGFMLGSLTTAVAYHVIGRDKAEFDSMTRWLVTVIVITAWTLSFAKDLYTGSYETPLLLWVFFGGIVGSLNKWAGEFIVQFMTKK